MATNNNLRIDNAVLTFRNFAGERKMYNDEGRRNFCVYLDGFNRKGEPFENPDYIPKYKYGPDWLGPNELIPALEADGWNVKFTKESEDGEYKARPYLKVNVKYNPAWPQFNPKVNMVKTNGEVTPLDENSVHLMDSVWIRKADVIIKPNNYVERKGIENGKVSADLKKLYVTPVEDADEDDFDGRYEVSRNNDVDDIPFN